MLEVITKESPRWPEFIYRLDTKLAEWDCTTNHDQAHAVFAEMGGIDSRATIEYLCKHGGHCDCEIMFNVVDWEAEV